MTQTHLELILERLRILWVLMKQFGIHSPDIRIQGIQQCTMLARKADIGLAQLTIGMCLFLNLIISTATH